MSAPLTTETVWLVTGCSSGLGLAFCQQILSAGHKLIATARNPSSLSVLASDPNTTANLLTLPLDVTSSNSIKEAFAAGLGKFKHIDVVINNAGYSLMGDTENAKDEDARKLLDTDFWGAVNVSMEAVRVMRDVNEKEKGGLIVQMSSMGGIVTVPSNSFYHASKFALEGWTESVSKEMLPVWNIKFLILEPGGVKTNFGTSSLKTINMHPAYADPSAPSRQLMAFMTSLELDDWMARPEKVAEVTFQAVVKGGKLPLRLPLGADSWESVKKQLTARLEEIEEWKSVSESTMSKEAGDSARKIISSIV